MESATKNWSSSALQAFTMRMAGHGFSVSSTLMNYDRVYALEQLQMAHALADAPLREMAMELFRQFDRPSPRLGYAN
jgi:hypothetical protein